MGKEMKSLLKDTAIYGISSIVGRFLNYLLVPLYTIKITAESGGYYHLSSVEDVSLLGDYGLTLVCGSLADALGLYGC